MNKLKLKCLIASFVCIAAFSTFNPAHKVKADTTTVGVSYDAHVQNIGWQNPWAKDGGEAGTDGQALRVEALKIKLENAPAGAKISYQTHVQNVGWQDWVSDGAEAGTDGKSLRVEAIRIKLENMPGYSVQYQAHVENVGWQDWVSDGAEAGTDGKGLRVEAVKIRIVKNVNANSITLNKTSDALTVGDTDTLSASFNPDNTTNKNVTWSSSDSNIVSVDKSGKITANRACNATVTATSEDGQKTASCNVTVNANTKEPKVTYQTHVQNIGWQAPVSDGQEAGTEGKALRIEALKMNLENAPANAKITYHAYVQNIGWQGYGDVNAGEVAGTIGQNLGIEAFTIDVSNLPNYHVEYRAYVQNLGWQDWVTDNKIAGTMGKNLRVEAIEAKLVKNSNIPVLDKTEITMKVGSYESFNTKFDNPSSDSNDINIKWQSSDDSIASFQNGYLCAFKPGDITITASCSTTPVGGDQNEAVCKVHVIPNDGQYPPLTIDNSNLSLDINGYSSLSVAGSIYPLTWSSSNSSIVSVISPNDTSCNLKGNKQGTAVITAKTPDGRTISSNVTVTNKTIISFGSVYVEDSILTALYGNDNTVKHVYTSDIPKLEHLSVSGYYRFGHPDLSGIEYFTNLKDLSLTNNYVDNISKLSALTNLENLTLDSNPVTDISPIKNLTNLKSLTLGTEQYSNKDTIAVLKALPNLKSLTLVGTISDSDLQNLKTQLPNCTITVK
ncbi:Ig-like domain-containing protein [Clostridium felsineum]|uniref:Ig-like domain-containing protein n=1 Tax=Clostridium felsineum TaxID=36839 RepID=UPI00214D1D66|nr:Ig-like domain-containing protein [Clostridium felsineum]MCR3761663.1 Ig-like domain-containing protein [Clostridium felsineum]